MLDTGVHIEKLESVRYYAGFPMSAHHVIAASRRSWRRRHDLHRETDSPPPLAQEERHRLTRRDYEGAITTLCAGCGHDSITAAIIQALGNEHSAAQGAKLSGIGCSSKTPAYFLREAHGFNSVHGRMPAVATGANAANAT